MAEYKHLFKTGTVKTGRFEMKYFRFGNGLRTMVVIPGLSIMAVTDSAPAVAEEYAVFREEYTVYVFERRTDPPEQYSVRDMAKDTYESFLSLGLTDVFLFGASQGGMIAMLIAAAHPETVKKLALASTASRVNGPACSVIRKWTDYAKDRDGAGLFLDFGEKIYPSQMFEKSRDMLRSAGLGVRDEDLDRFERLADGMKDFNAEKELGKIRCPVLVIASKDDRVLGEDAYLTITGNLSSGIYSEAVIYDGYGHAVYDTAPDCRDRIFGFFNY